MRLTSTFTADYKAYLASQEQSQTDRSSLKGVENYELVSKEGLYNATGAGPCQNSIFAAGPCVKSIFDFSDAGPCNTLQLPSV